jgi:hypothetical protein
LTLHVDRPAWAWSPRRGSWVKVKVEVEVEVKVEVNDGVYVYVAVKDNVCGRRRGQRQGRQRSRRIGAALVDTS